MFSVNKYNIVENNQSLQGVVREREIGQPSKRHQQRTFQFDLKTRLREFAGEWGGQTQQG